jgi:hypothetical protein
MAIKGSWLTSAPAACKAALNASACPTGRVFSTLQAGQRAHISARTRPRRISPAPAANRRSAKVTPNVSASATAPRMSSVENMLTVNTAH